MTTKNDLSFLKHKQNSQTAVNGSQYSNLSLNKNHKFSILIPVQSYCKSPNDKSCDSTKTENYKEKEKLQSRNESSDFCLSSLTLYDKSEDRAAVAPWKKKDSSNHDNNNSTLSLHISAYEISTKAVVASDASEDALKEEKSKSTKQIFIASNFDIQNPFEFPRQQNDKVREPEVSQFRANQQLLNPNESLGSSIGTTQADTKRIYCVVSKDIEDLTELQQKQLNKAYELLKQNNAKVGVASVNKVMNMTTKVAGLSYIIPELCGDLYDHLVSHGARIYGPLAIIQSLTKTGKIPKSPKPLLAMYCSNFNVTVTGLTLEERANVFERVDALGGVSSGVMTARTTHLFARMCDAKSEKYQRAVKDKIMIVNPDWVDFAYEAAREGTLSNIIPMDDYLVKVFSGCEMTTSGFNGDQRLKISELVRQNGGEFSGHMAQLTCTHLIIDSNTGEKYRKALEWGTVKIVTLRWLMKCAESGIRHDEDKYQPGIKTSTQSVHNKTLDPPDVSAIFSKPRYPLPPSSVSSNASIVAGDHTMMNNRDRNATATALIGSVVTPLKMPFLTSTPRNQSSSQLTTKVADPVMDFDITLLERFGDYLEDCRLHFYEIRDEQKRSYRRLANCTGCAIADSIDSATHIIVPPGNYSTRHINRLKEAVESDVEVVRCEWLMDCVQKQNKLDTEAYVFPGLRENEPASGPHRIRGSSSAQEFRVTQDVLNAINPSCDLSSMHNTRSFEQRLEDVNIENKDGEEQEGDEDFEHNETTFNDDEEMAEDDLDQTISGVNICQPFVHDESDKESVAAEEIGDKGNESEFDAFGNVAGDEEQNDARSNQSQFATPKPSNQDGLNLSMPLHEYLSGDRPVKLHLPFDQLHANFSDESEPDSPTVDVLKLKATLAQMAKNSCQTDSEYIAAVGNEVRDDRDWREMSLYRQPVNHDFRSPLKRPLPELPKRQNIQVENFDDAAAATVDGPELEPLTDNDDDAAAEIQALNDEENGVEEDAVEKEVEASKDDDELVEEDTLTVPQESAPLQKTKSFGTILQPDLLKRCEAIASRSTTAAENGDNAKSSQPRKSAPVPTAIERLAHFNDELSFSNDKDASQRDGSPAKVVWEAPYSTQDLAKLDANSKHPNFIPSTQMLANDDFFDVDSADPFQRLSNQNLFKQIKAKNTQEKMISQTKKKNDEATVVPLDVNNEPDEATVVNKDDGKGEKEIVAEKENEGDAMVVDEPAVEVEKVQENVVETERIDEEVASAKQAAVEPVPQEEEDSFNATWPECPLPDIQPPKVTKVKPQQRRRLFGLEEESEEGTENSESDKSVTSVALLAGVKPKPKRQPLAPVVNLDDSIQVVENIPPPQPSSVSKDDENFAVPQLPNRATQSRRSSRRNSQAGKKGDVEISRKADAVQPTRASQRLKRNAEEASRSPHATEPEAKLGKRRSSSSATEEQPKSDGKKNKSVERTLPPTPSNNYSVIFTNFDPQEKTKLQEQVIAIQGTNLDTTIQMPDAYIVICNKLQRSEKLMIALAAGKYVVPSTYIIESNRKGLWLPREDFEYGNPKSARRRIDFSNVRDAAVAEQIKNACYRLRYKAESLGHGAFHGWKVLVFAQSTVAESLIRIIECGGGEASLFTNVTHKEYKNFTMAIITSKSGQGLFTTVESQILNQYKIPYYTDQVLSNYLLSPDTENALKKSWHKFYHDFMKPKRK